MAWQLGDILVPWATLLLSTPSTLHCKSPVLCDTKMVPKWKYSQSEHHHSPPSIDEFSGSIVDQKLVIFSMRLCCFAFPPHLKREKSMLNKIVNSTVSQIWISKVSCHLPAIQYLLHSLSIYLHDPINPIVYISSDCTSIDPTQLT